MDKFPSIPHLSFSPQINNDDIIISDTKLFIGGHSSFELCIHEKLDGGNCCIFKGNVYARTHKHPTKHAWFNTIKALIRCQPLFYEEQYSKLMLFGENMTAIHSISYSNLTSYFYIFAVYNPSIKIWYSVNDVKYIAHQLNIPTAPLLFKGNFNSLQAIKDWMDMEIKKPSILGSVDREGFVIRINSSFHMKQFEQSMAKYVRKGHIQTDKNWIRTWKKVQLIHSEQKSDDKNMKQFKKKKKKCKPSLKTSLIICCGLPGSGKSTFAKHLCGHRDEWERAGTDLFGKDKNAVFSFVARIAKNKQKKCIVENCNVTVAKRAELLDCAFKPRNAVCVYFDIDRNQCVNRAKKRGNHETKNLFKHAKGNKIIHSFAKQLQIPTAKEGFKHIITIQNDSDINALLSRLGVKQCIKSSYIKEVQQEEKKNDYDNDEAKAEEHKANVSRKKQNFLIKNDNDLYVALMAKSRFAMNVKSLCKKLQLEINKVLNIYVIGSRVWGNAQSSSDWDVIIVTNDKNDRVFVSVGNVDAYILDKYQWKRELNHHRFVCWLTLFLPNQAIWKENLSVSHVNKNEVNSDKSLNDVKVHGFGYGLFVNALSREIEKDIKKINKFYRKNKLDKVYKTFIHSYRMINICKKIIVLLQETYAINDNNDSIDIECESFADNSLIGLIKFDEIEDIIRQKQKQLESSNSDKHTSDIWLNQLRNGVKQCQDLIS